MSKIENKSNSVRSPEQTVQPEWIEINPKYKLHTLPFEHNMDLLPGQLPTLQNGITHTDASILEYFPADIDGKPNNSLLTTLSHTTSWFKAVSKICQENGKDIFSLDPAQSTNNYLLVFRGSVAAAVAAALGSNLLIATKANTLTRRDFLKLIGVLAFEGTVAMPGISLNFEPEVYSPIPNETFFRMAVVAELIDGISQRIQTDSPKPVSHALIYPPFHIARIKRLLQFPAERKRILNNMAFLKKVPRFEKDFYQGEKYHWEDTGWQKTESITI